MEITRFQPTQFFADGNTVVVLVDLEFIARATGIRVVEPDEVHIWRFNDKGEVQRFRHRADTWLSAMALRGDRGTTAGQDRPSIWLEVPLKT